MNAGDITVTSALYAKVTVPDKATRNGIPLRQWARSHAVTEWGIDTDAVEAIQFTDGTNDGPVVTVKFNPEHDQND